MLEQMQQIFTEYLPANSWWLQLCLIALLTLLASTVLSRFLARLSTAAARSEIGWDDAVIEAAQLPIIGFIYLSGVYTALDILGREFQVHILGVLLSVFDSAVVLLVSWFLLRLIHASEAHIVSQGRTDSGGLDVATARAIGKLLRVSVGIVAGLMLLQSFGVSVSGILAFGGIGGIAVGFAAKDLLANFFGGLTIYLDRPFTVGDWIRSPDRDIEGTVEDIGWRLTRIRTFEQRPLYVPNSVFTQIAVENPSRMLNRRIKETIGIRYQDSGLVAQIVTDVKSMLVAHPDIDTSRTLMVNLLSFGPSSLDFFVYTFTKTTNWVEFHAIKQDVLLQILAIIHGHGADVAFPTRTLQLDKDWLRTEPVPGQ